MILPVDPMAWVGQIGLGTRGASQEHDVLLSVSDDGELAFWVPGDDSSVQVKAPNGHSATTLNGAGSSAWTCTGKVRTGRKGLTIARCSSAKKSVLGRCAWSYHVLEYLLKGGAHIVVPIPEGEELTIWDSKESEFSLGLEYRQTLRCARDVPTSIRH